MICARKTAVSVNVRHLMPAACARAVQGVRCIVCCVANDLDRALQCYGRVSAWVVYGMFLKVRL